MTELFLPLRDSFLLSPRTASYMDALIREGDKFDYSKWLERVREGEAQAKQGLRTFISKDLIAPEIGNQTGTSDGIWPNSKLMTRTVPTPRALRRPHPQAESKTPKARVMRQLERISSAWDDFRPAGLATRCTGTWGLCSQSLSITKCGEGPRDFCDMRSNLLRCLSTGMWIHLLPSFASRVEMLPITRRSANGRGHCVMSLVARFAEAVEDVHEGSRRGQCMRRSVCEILWAGCPMKLFFELTHWYFRGCSAGHSG